MLVCLQELRSGEYDCDYHHKVVLDVGGFEGESAVFFWMNGAKKIIIYEPVIEHIRLIEKNIELNKINAEIHPTGIGDKDGTLIIKYNNFDPGFGVQSKGEKSIEIKIKDASKAIEESGAEIAKFDCEGAEESLVHVREDILQKIGYYIIEVHSSKIKTEIIEKFQKSGFILENELVKAKMDHFSVLTFKKKQ